MGEVLIGKGCRSRARTDQAQLGLLLGPQELPAFRRGTCNLGIICSYQNLERENNFPSWSLQGGLGSPPQGLLSHATRCPHMCQPAMLAWGGAAEVDKRLLGSWQMVLSSLSNLGASGRAITEDLRLNGQTKTRKPKFSGPSGTEICRPLATHCELTCHRLGSALKQMCQARPG